MKSIYYFYILQCNDGCRYYGHTNDLYQRLKEHSRGRVLSTGNRLPVEVIYYEELKTRSEALRREMSLSEAATYGSLLKRHKLQG